MEAGKHRARGIEGVLAYTNGGKEQVAVSFELLDHPGELITWYGQFGGGTDITIKALRAMGWRGDDLSDLQGVDGNEVELVVEEDTYNGKTSLKVAWVNPPGGGGVAVKAPMPADAAKAFAARMRGAVIQANGGTTTAAPRTAPARRGPPEPPPHTDSDSPPV